MHIYFIYPGDIPLLPKDAIEKLKDFGEVITISHKGKLADIQALQTDTEDKVLAVDPDAFEWDLDVESLGELVKNVKAVVTSSTSYDWIKPVLLKEKGILAINCAGFSTDSVAEYAVALSMQIARRIPLHMKNNWQINWDTQPLQIRGSTVGIIGLGRIGKRIAENFQGLGANVTYWSKSSRDDRFEYKELDELLKSSQIIIPALIENNETKGLLGNDKLDLLRKDALFIGLNRIKVIFDEDYLLKLVAENKISGYAFEGDNAKPVSEYVGNVWPSVTVAWFTQQSLDNLMTMWVENVIAVCQGNPQSVVN